MNELDFRVIIQNGKQGRGKGWTILYSTKYQVMRLLLPTYLPRNTAVPRLIYKRSPIYSDISVDCLISNRNPTIFTFNVLLYTRWTSEMYECVAYRFDPYFGISGQRPRSFNTQHLSLGILIMNIYEYCSLQ